MEDFDLAAGALRPGHSADRFFVLSSRGDKTLYRARLRTLRAVPSAPGDYGPTHLLSIHLPLNQIRLDASVIATLHCLSEAEARVASMAATCSSVASVARQLSLSMNTVKTHLKRVFSKLGVRTRAEMTALLLSGPGWRLGDEEGI